MLHGLLVNGLPLEPGSEPVESVLRWSTILLRSAT